MPKGRVFCVAGAVTKSYEHKPKHVRTRGTDSKRVYTTYGSFRYFIAC